MAKIIIKNGLVVDPAQKISAIMDILIVDGKIAKIAKTIRVSGAKIINAIGLLVLPGLVDLHTHLRDPGQSEKETIATGTKAAAKGGFTSICCMANTNPPADSPAVVRYIKDKAASQGVVNVYPIAAVTKGLRGELLAEMGLNLQAGAVAFSDDGRPIMDARIMRLALEYSRQFGVPIIAHCEEANLAKDGVMNEGALSTAMGLPGIPALAEELMVARDIRLVKEYGGSLHIAHISTARSVDLVRQAKKQGISVTCETCPHYFTLTEAAVNNYNTNAKVNPPLRTEADVKAIKRGLKDGTIDIIATDHAPHNIELKDIEFNSAAFGMVGLETALPLVLTELVNTKILSLSQAIEKLTLVPARRLKLDKGTLMVGAEADVVIVDPRVQIKVEPSEFASKSHNTPFAGRALYGKVLFTVVGGKFVVTNGQLVSNDK
ncbi:dihydroorotase [Candidatus Saganbacteria bacterium CG08_land_8_20_14_0_20_45_16]|uniref:Dihydroorotase n=1 Tax=Candidatus Saganbacteria bacterium CG08_land_8_20_14_0_20_45_16 TaxID=2014293 RepID=A0A2H0Y062_UNCSA|nr:MAG: dihydroorotase [Candidatus Saganbacteria bacterium CG08_land_8_20_14_0_20_45_16]